MIKLSKNGDGYLLIWQLNIAGIGTITKQVSEEEAIKHFPGLCTKIELQSNEKEGESHATRNNDGRGKERRKGYCRL